MSNLEKNKSVVVIGGGIMGLGSAWYLTKKGYKVTVLERQPEVAMVASSINGAMICPSMCASWASMKLVSEVSFYAHFHIRVTPQYQVSRIPLNYVEFNIF